MEVDDLRRALSHQADELQRAEEEKNRIASQKSDVARTVALLESDLKRVRRDAEAFGRDLKNLRAEKERWEAKQKDEAVKAERARKQSQTQIRLLNEQLEGQREKARRAKEDLRNHVCYSEYVASVLSLQRLKLIAICRDVGQLSAIKVQHNKECKGLIVQIRYLKAKFTRESTLRYDLGYQKQYLLVLLTKFETRLVMSNAALNLSLISLSVVVSSVY
jgi:chromosome segregation ATPase